MKRPPGLLCRCLAALLWLAGARPGGAQVTVGSAPASATALVDWPTISYAAIDVSSSVQGDSSVDQVLLAEDGGVTFSFRGAPYTGSEDADAGDTADEAQADWGRGGGASQTDFTCTEQGGEAWHVARWSQGTVVADQVTRCATHRSYSYEPDSPNGHPASKTLVDVGWGIEVAGLTQAGELVGIRTLGILNAFFEGGAPGSPDTNPSYPFYPPSVEQKSFYWLFSAGGGALQNTSAPAPFKSFKLPAGAAGWSGYPTGAGSPIRYDVRSVSGSGRLLVKTHGIEVGEGEQSLYDDCRDEYYYVSNGAGISALFQAGDTSSATYDSGAILLPGEPNQVNDNGWVLGPSVQAYDASGAAFFSPGFVWNGGSVVSLHNAQLEANEGDDSPTDINDSNQVVVTSAGSDDDPNTGGYLWENGTQTFLRAKLPKYLQAQVTSLQPLMISEQGADGSIAILASVVQGDDPWFYAVCQRDGAGKWSFAKAIIPDGVSPQGIKSDGGLVGLGSLTTANIAQSSKFVSSATPTPPPTPSPTAAFNLPQVKVTFDKSGVANRTSSQGFDKENPNAPWLMVPLNGSNSADKCTVDKAENAKQVTIVAVNPAVSTLTATPAGSFAVNATGVAVGDTKFEARLTGSSTATKTLNIAVKKHVHRTVALHVVTQVYATARGGHQAGEKITPANILAANTVKPYLNGIFSQANIDFDVSDEPFEADYDLSGDGALAASNDYGPTGEEKAVEAGLFKKYPKYQSQNNPAPTVHIFYVNGLNNASGINPATPLLGNTDPPRNYSYVQSNANYVRYLHTTAHELGHTYIMGALVHPDEKDKHDVKLNKMVPNSAYSPDLSIRQTRLMVSGDEYVPDAQALCHAEWDITNRNAEP